MALKKGGDPARLPESGKRCFTYCGDERCDCSLRGTGDGYLRGPLPTPAGSVRDAFLQIGDPRPGDRWWLLPVRQSAGGGKEIGYTMVVEQTAEAAIKLLNDARVPGHKGEAAVWLPCPEDPKEISAMPWPCDGSAYRGDYGRMNPKVFFRRAGDFAASEIPWCLDARCHSPDGLSWGYRGSGPSQCALAVLTHAAGAAAADALYHGFADEIVARLPRDACWDIRKSEILKWVFLSRWGVKTKLFEAFVVRPRLGSNDLMEPIVVAQTPQRR